MICIVFEFNNALLWFLNRKIESINYAFGWKNRINQQEKMVYCEIPLNKILLFAIIKQL